jgi:hypothetical protein
VCSVTLREQTWVNSGDCRSSEPFLFSEPVAPAAFGERQIALRIASGGPLFASRPGSILSSAEAWDLAQDEFGVKGADFIGVMGRLLLEAAQDQFKTRLP